MANNYGPDEVAIFYSCRCGDTLTDKPASIEPCCIEKGWEPEIPEEKPNG